LWACLNALCFQVVLEEVLQMVATLKVSLDREKPFLEHLLRGIQKKSLKLIKHLSVSTLGMKKCPSELKMEMAIDDLVRGKERVLSDNIK
jgi:hypothetical protein